MFLSLLALLSPISLCFCSFSFEAEGGGEGSVMVTYMSAGGGCGNPDYSSGQYSGTYVDNAGTIYELVGDADPEVCLNHQNGDN